MMMRMSVLDSELFVKTMVLLTQLRKKMMKRKKETTRQVRATPSQTRRKKEQMK
jgi:hypothetical protein